MSVLIRGMEMPTSCMLCNFCVEEADPANGEMCMATGTLMPPCTRERLDNCPLLPVPPHGRLIDADEIYDAVEQRYRISSGEEHRRERDLLDLICSAPTIIPPSGGKEDE